MRKTFLTLGILAAGAMLLLSSCDKKEDGLNIDNKTRNEFMATIQQCEAEDNIETKTYTDDGRRVLWRISDIVSILQGRDLNEIFKVKEIFTEGTTAVLEKVGDEVASPTTFNANIAYYPYYANMKYVGDNTNHAITVNIPSTQTYKENSFGVGALPMVAVTKSKSDYDFEFKNLFGFLKLKLMTKDISYDIVNKIIIRGNNNEKICGEAIVKCSSNGDPTIEFSDNAGTEIVLNCSNKRICTNTTEFWIALPPITFTKGIAVEIVTLGNYPTKRQSSAQLTINRSKIKPMEVLTFTELSRVPIPDINFRKYLLNKCDKNNDGYISFSEVDNWNKGEYQQKGFYVENKNIGFLDGIEYFTALTSLECGENQLTSLDLSNNIDLQKLECWNNKLTSGV
ncbi:MAG: fimbrillin family protein [Bacteroidales bacterium]|nr:fimbrillin family protein [Bacteroidales bacterium]